MVLNKMVDYKGQKYYGRFVENVDEFGNIEKLLMFDELLGDVLSQHFDGTADYDKTAEDIDKIIFCYVPIEVLQLSDREVIKWCKRHDVGV